MVVVTLEMLDQLLDQEQWELVELVVCSQENLDIIQHQQMVVMLHNLPAVVEAVMDNLTYMLGQAHPTVVVLVVPVSS